ncbi:hypothetical protein MKW94_018126 [Papaver nudicaule]|uniref:J domain-containing protein n=1 Tax=Papaver nudicaule TaxID=74823 RepID=A0AA41RMX0_PAPNU|nr:hypothetical protein [Papaver nudicaule]
MEIDHYAVLGLPSGEQGAKLTDADINKAYKIKALELHPDKRPDDPNANINFLKLSDSYEILKDKDKRKKIDDRSSSLSVQCQRQSSQDDPRKRKMRDDLHERECASFAPDPDELAREESYAKNLETFRKKIYIARYTRIRIVIKY